MNQKGQATLFLSLNITYMKKRILIIEDDLILALSVEMMLKKIGFNHIEKAETGDEALEIIETFTPDVLLVDINLGAGMSGIETVKKIQDSVQIPALYVTGNSDNYFRTLAEQTNFIGYLIKPITLRELDDVLSSHYVSEVN